MERDKIIVTGGLGYIGSHTCVALHEAGYDPIIIDNLSNSNIKSLRRIESIIGRGLSFYSADCRDLSHLTFIFRKESTVKGVIHFAALKSVNESINNPLEYYDNNVHGLLNILKCIEQNNVDSFVFSSSCTVYGIPDSLPVKESDTLNTPTNPYGFTKYIGEKMIEDWDFKNNKSPVILRYFNPIGAHPSYKIGELPNGIPSNLVPYLTQTVIGRREKITIYGRDYNTPDGTCIRDYINVCDLAEAHVKSIEYSLLKKGTEHFNIGTGYGTSVKEIIDTFESVNSVKLNYVYGDRREGDIPEIYSNCDKSRSILKWKPRFTLEESLRSAWEWEKNLAADK
jgi:UDP-glucose 4-epimerase